jgi:hypothetical protein
MMIVCQIRALDFALGNRTRFLANWPTSHPWLDCHSLKKAKAARSITVNPQKFMTKTGFIMLLLVLGACSSENTFQPTMEKQGPDVVDVMGTPTVPYHEDFATTFSFVPPFPDPPSQPFSNFIIRGTGNTSHGGRSQQYSESQLNVLTGIQTGTTVVTGASGRELWYEYEGPASDPDENGNLSFAGTLTITGGTGIFENASGEGTYQGTANVMEGVGSLLVDADLTLSLPRNSNRNDGN